MELWSFGRWWQEIKGIIVVETELQTFLCHFATPLYTTSPTPSDLASCWWQLLFPSWAHWTAEKWIILWNTDRLFMVFGEVRLHSERLYHRANAKQDSQVLCPVPEMFFWKLVWSGGSYHRRISVPLFTLLRSHSPHSARRQMSPENLANMPEMRFVIASRLWPHGHTNSSREVCVCVCVCVCVLLSVSFCDPTCFVSTHPTRQIWHFFQVFLWCKSCKFSHVWVLLLSSCIVSNKQTGGVSADAASELIHSFFNS